MPPTTTRAVTYQFNSDYFSGLDVNVFFNDYLMDEMINIQYQLSETVTPLFDYASYRYKTIVKGGRMVQGSFSVNFKYAFYVKEIIAKALGVDNDVLSPTDSPVGVESPANLNNQLSTTDILDILENKSNSTVPNRQLKDIAAYYRKAFWARSSSKKPAPDLSGPFFSQSTDGFTIYIKYKKKVFDYDVVPTITEAEKGYINTSAPYAIESIQGVHIQSVGKAIDDSGKNIIEVYNFIGKDLILGSE